jgi:hypothetical protein
MDSLELLNSWAIEMLERVGERGIEWTQQRLTPSERELLLTAEETGEPIMIIRTNQTGEFIIAGQKAYHSLTDRLVQEEGLKALALLNERKLVRTAKGQYYELTSAGIKKARAMKQESGALAMYGRELGLADAQ